MKNKSLLKLATTILLLPVFTKQTIAQRIYQPAQYYFNQYLSNAAMAGKDEGLHLYAGYNRLMDNIEGSPANIFFTADYYAGKRVGLGINVSNIKAGILQYSKALLTYAYHLPVGPENQQISFGLSGGFINQRLDQSKVIGNSSDPTLQTYNTSGIKMDGDVGIAYTDDHLNIQVSVPSIREHIDKGNKEFIDKNTFFLSGSYKFKLDETVNSVIPLVAFSKIKGFENVLDLGASIQFLNNIGNIQALYHSTKNFTLGIGAKIAQQYDLQLFYSSQPENIRSYTSALFSVNLKVNLFEK